jgi:xanthine dehydrogenase molybdenum-binding subunit
MTSTLEPTKILGTNPIRPDGIDKVTGRANYGADVNLPRMLFARLKKSPHAHAIIKKIDVSKALALPGVEAVVTAADFPDVTMEMAGSGPGASPRKFLIGNFIAVDKVLYYGHPVAAVAATNVHIAEDALDLIEVEYEVLPPVLTAERAMAPDAPILHPGMRTAEPTGGKAEDRDSNVAAHLQVATGDIDAGFAEADVIVEEEFHTSTAHQGYIEPHTATADWQNDGSLVIYSSSQGSFQIVRDPLATILKMPASRIRAVPMEIGGGFGGKNRIYCEPLAAILAKKTGKPVKLTMTREEVLEASGPTSGAWIRAKLGAKKDGTFTAFQMWIAYEAGGFPGSSVGGGLNTSLGQYKIDNVTMDGYDVLVNRPRNAAYRAPGVPAPNYAIESLVDMVAEKLDIDPIDIRIQNSSTEGTRRPNGVIIGPNGNREVMQAIKNSAHYRSELTGKNRGRGVAIGFWNAGAGAHSMNATLNADGSITLNAGAVDIGGLRATEAMTMAEVLGIPYETVIPRIVDTDSIGWTSLTAGSGTGAGTSASAYLVANQIRDRVVERAAKIWDVDASACSYDRERAVVVGPNGEDGKPREMTFKQVAAQQAGSGGYISGHVDNSGAQGGPTYAGNIVDVEVDEDTGKVTVLRFTVVQDAGNALHTAYVEGQLQGGAAQGIGMALTEEYFYDDSGVLRNASLLDYRIPTTLDVPMIETIIVEVPNPGHPLGVRGVGECAIVVPMAAVSNAVANAVGMRPTSMPVSPRKLIEMIMDRDGIQA